jgi:hypothetical protein
MPIPAAVANRLPSLLNAKLMAESASLLSLTTSLPVATYHTCGAAYIPWAAIRRPSGLNGTQAAPAALGLVFELRPIAIVSCPDAASQTRTIWSRPADLNCFPSGLNATQVAPFACALIARCSLPVSVCQILTVASSLAVAIHCQSGLKAMLQM